MKLNGWHRLWIVSSALFGVVVAAFAINAALDERLESSLSTLRYVKKSTLPLLEPTYAEFERRKPTPGDSDWYSRSQKLKGELFEIWESGDVALLMPTRLPMAQKSGIVDDLSGAAKRELRGKRIAIGLDAFLIWALICASVLGFGHSIAWIIRGFR